MVRHMSDAERCALMREKLYTPVISDRGEGTKSTFLCTPLGASLNQINMLRPRSCGRRVV